MSYSTAVLEKLHQFGLNEIECQIYLYILNKNPQSILNIAKNLNIPRTSIYDNSQKLIEKGLVEKIIEYKTQKIKAYPLDILEHLIDKEKERVEKLNDTLEFLKQNLSPIVNLSLNTQVRYYSGVQGFRQMIWNTLAADKEVVGYSIFGRKEIVGEKFYKKYSKEFKLRGLVDRCIINPRKETLDVVEKDITPGESQITRDNIRIFEAYELYTSGDTSIYNNTFAVCYWKEGEVVGVEIENAELVKTQKTIFELLWKVAKPIADIL
jgi:sugar-specific transcriptional regulator TrmB